MTMRMTTWHHLEVSREEAGRGRWGTKLTAAATTVRHGHDCMHVRTLLKWGGGWFLGFIFHFILRSFSYNMHVEGLVLPVCV